MQTVQQPPPVQLGIIAAAVGPRAVAVRAATTASAWGESGLMPSTAVLGSISNAKSAKANCVRAACAISSLVQLS
ncbi:hypothetical protein ACWEWG_05680 [Streptomyces sp. NPDC003758]